MLTTAVLPAPTDTEPQHSANPSGATLYPLFAIRLDGSEVAVTGVPSRISFDDLETAPARAAIEAAMLALTAATPRDLSEADHERIALAILLLLASAVLGRCWLAQSLARSR